MINLYYLMQVIQSSTALTVFDVCSLISIQLLNPRQLFFASVFIKTIFSKWGFLYSLKDTELLVVKIYLNIVKTRLIVSRFRKTYKNEDTHESNVSQYLLSLATSYGINISQSLPMNLLFGAYGAFSATSLVVF